MSSRRNLSYLSLRSNPNSRSVNLLQPLFPYSVAPVLCFQSFAASFPKTPGVGVPARELVRCTEAQKCLSVPPLPAALTHSVSRKSFPCHSYENTRDGSATVAPASASVSLGLVGNPNSARPLARHSPLPTGAAVPPILHFWGFPTFLRSVILSQRARIQYIQ